MINEKVSATLKKRMKAMRSKIECEECGCQVPVYPGRYPGACPECGTSYGQKKTIEETTPWKQFVYHNPEWMNFSDFSTEVNEDSTEDAYNALKAIIGSLKNRGDSKEVKEMMKMANGIHDYYKKEKSFAPKQAEWIFNTSKALFK